MIYVRTGIMVQEAQTKINIIMMIGRTRADLEEERNKNLHE